MAKQRIDKLLSHQGFGTRKDIKKLLRQADVFLNGKQIYDPSITIDPQTDVLTIDDEQIDFTEHYYIMMNKVAHTVSSKKDGEHQTVFDLLDESFHTPYLEEKLHLVGRLDMDTEGLLLFTTDGELTHKLISPKSNINKTYFCVLEKPESENHKKQIEELFLQGIEVGPEDTEPGFKCQSATVKWATSEQIQKWLDKSTYFGKHNSCIAYNFGRKISPGKKNVPSIAKQSCILKTTFNWKITIRYNFATWRIQIII